MLEQNPNVEPGSIRYALLELKKPTMLKGHRMVGCKAIISLARTIQNDSKLRTKCENELQQFKQSLLFSWKLAGIEIDGAATLFELLATAHQLHNEAEKLRRKADRAKGGVVRHRNGLRGNFHAASVLKNHLMRWQMMHKKYYGLNKSTEVRQQSNNCDGVCESCLFVGCPQLQHGGYECDICRFAAAIRLELQTNGRPVDSGMERTVAKRSFWGESPCCSPNG